MSGGYLRRTKVWILKQYIGCAVFEDRDSMAGMEREGACSIFYTFLGM